MTVVITTAIGDLVVDKATEQCGIIEEIWGYEAQLIKIKWNSPHLAISWTHQENVIIIRHMHATVTYRKPIPFYPHKQPPKIYSTPPRKKAFATNRNTSSQRKYRKYLNALDGNLNVAKH